MTKNQNILLAAVIVIIFAAAMLALSAVPTALPPALSDAPTEAPTDAQSFVTAVLSETRVLLNWDPIEGADSYRVTYDDGSGATDLGTAKTGVFRSSGLKGGTAYTFAVQGMSEQNGQGAAVGEALTVSGRTLPEAPVVKAKRSGNTCTLSWNAVKGADHYTIESSSDGETWYSEGETTDTAYTVTADGADIYIAVRAVIRSSSGDLVGDYHRTFLTTRKKTGKMISFGDSVAAGYGAHSCSYADIFAQKHNLTLTDQSVIDGQLSFDNAKKPHILESLSKDVNNDYDYVFIEGGCNDHLYNCPLGEVASDWDYDFDEKTTCGALESALNYLEDHCPDAKVVFVMIHRRKTAANKLGLTFEDYAEAIRAVCAKYDVPVADVFKDGALDASDPELCGKYTAAFNGVFPGGDGLHPTEEAHRKFYLPLIEKALKENE